MFVPVKICDGVGSNFRLVFGKYAIRTYRLITLNTLLFMHLMLHAEIKGRTCIYQVYGAC